MYICRPIKERKRLKSVKTNNIKINRNMLIIPVKEGENIERAIKKYKKKFEKTKVMRELRARREFTKPSITNRQANIKAAYKQRMQSAEI